MQEADYHRYIKAFNARDYSALEAFFADDFALENAGFRVEGKKAFREFYAFFHEFCREEVIFKGFFPQATSEEGESYAGGSFMANVVIRFTGIKELSQDVLDAKGYSGMTPVPVGVSVNVEFYIHYIFNSNGLIQFIKGAVWVPEEI